MGGFVGTDAGTGGTTANDASTGGNPATDAGTGARDAGAGGTASSGGAAGTGGALAADAGTGGTASGGAIGAGGLSSFDASKGGNAGMDDGGSGGAASTGGASGKDASVGAGGTSSTGGAGFGGLMSSGGRSPTDASDANAEKDSGSNDATTSSTGGTGGGAMGGETSTAAGGATVASGGTGFGGAVSLGGRSATDAGDAGPDADSSNEAATGSGGSPPSSGGATFGGMSFGGTLSSDAGDASSTSDVSAGGNTSADGSIGAGGSIGIGGSISAGGSSSAGGTMSFGGATGGDAGDAAPETGAAVDSGTLDTGATSGWPASPTNTTYPQCVPNCTTQICGNVCSVGAPCAAGCCSGNTVTTTQVSSDLYPWTDAVPHVELAVDSADTLHYAYVTHTYFAAIADGVVQDYSYIWGNPSDPYTPTNEALTAFMTVGHRSTGDVLYLAYVAEPYFLTSPRSGRFGVVNGTYEDLPALPVDIAADPLGAPVILTATGLLRRNSGGTWDTVALPVISGASAQDLIIDPYGAWYVASSGNAGAFVSRLAQSGANWVTETLSTTQSYSPLLAYRDDVLHVSYTEGSTRTLVYARRVGSSWNQVHLDDWIAALGFAVDSCGAPHFGVTYYDGPGTYVGATYLRWTSAGWRSKTIDPNRGEGLALTLGSSNVYLGWYGDAWWQATLPQ